MLFFFWIAGSCQVKGMVSRFSACASYDARQINSIVYGPIGSEYVIAREVCPTARDSLPVKFTVSWLSHSIDSLLVLSFVKLALEMLSVPAESASCKCNGVCSRKDGQKAKGCPCKIRGEYCSDSCKCIMTAKKCQNQVGLSIFL